MAIKEILDEFQKTEIPQRSEVAAADREVEARIESLLIRINRCFVEEIFPGIFEMENDLNQMGFWNQISIGRSAAPDSGKPNIKDLTFFFYPEKIEDVPGYQRVQEVAYKASISATGDLRNIRFSHALPRKIPPTVEQEERIVPVDKVNARTVDLFLEKFILGALEIYRSDRSLR